MQTLKLKLNGTQDIAFSVKSCIVAGWTGRDSAAIAHHIAELAELGVAPPSTTPLYYRAACQQVTTCDTIEVVDVETSGEVEPVLFDDGTALYIGLGSDHTDRKLESHSVALSKQICAKPIATDVWRFDEVAEHLDQLVLRSYIRTKAEDEWTLYQDGKLDNIRPLTDLISGNPMTNGTTRLQPGTIMFCGTLGAIGGVRPAQYMKLEVHDPVLNRSISFSYETLPLPHIS